MTFRAERVPVDPVFVKLRHRRIRLGLSQREVGEKAGFDGNTIWAWESGAAIPRWESLRRWSRSLGMDLKAEVSNN